jgi:hypothetical protein
MMNNSFNRTRLIKRIIKLLIGCIIAIFLAFGCLTLIVRQDEIEDWFEVRETSRKLPEAEIRYNIMIEQILSTIEDTVLKENITSLRVGKQHGYTHCIRGSVNWTFGATRSYEEVVDDYIEAFTQMGWEHRPSQQNMHHFFISKTAGVSLDDWADDSEYDSEYYQEIYRVNFNYGEPWHFDCSGG